MQGMYWDVPPYTNSPYIIIIIIKIIIGMIVPLILIPIKEQTVSRGNIPRYVAQRAAHIYLFTQSTCLCTSV